MKIRKCATGKTETYKFDVWLKGSSIGKKKLSFLLRKDDDTDVECAVYKSVLKEIREYLATKPDVNGKHLPVPDTFICNNAEDNEDEARSDFFIMEDISSNCGFKRDILKGDHGLDYEHCIVTIAMLAKLHASSYCFKREKSLDMKSTFPVLKDKKMIPIMKPEVVSEIEKILKTMNGYEKYSEMFITALRGVIGNQKHQSQDSFDVVCHGQVSRENILFKYKHQMEMKQTCQEAVLTHLDQCYLG